MVLRSVLTQHQSNLNCVEMASNVTVAVATNEKVILQEEPRVDLTSAILLALENHLDSAKVVYSCCMAFTTMINILGKYD